MPKYRRSGLRASICAVVAAGSLLSAGCHLIFPFEVSGIPDGPGDAATLEGGPGDGPGGEVSSDGPPGDGKRADGAHPIDSAGGDSVTPGDGGLDAAPVVDAGAPDVGASDAGALGACIAGTQPFTLPWAPKMVVCEVGTGSIDQCGAPFLCQPGWHLCTASEYKANGGDTNGISGMYWIAACVRQGGVISAPKDGLCKAKCAPASAASAPVEWSCKGGGSVSWPSANVGVATSSSCHHLGVDAKANAAFWRSWSLSIKAAGAICCQ